MKILFFLFALFCNTFADEVFEKPLPFILGGVETQWGQYASSVIIDGPNEFCGGSVVENSHILTAASCLLNNNFEVINPFWFKVIAGDVFFSQESVRRVERGVSRIFIHPQFNSFTGENNIAVLRLDQPLPTPHNTIEIALRQTRIVSNNFPCQLVGFGRQSNTTVAWRARQAAVTQNTADRTTCRIESNIHANRIADSQMCVTSSAAAGPCAGNLGSGLYCDGFLTGVLSAGITCTAIPSVYQQVRAFNSWIDEQFTRNDFGNAAGTVPFNVEGIPRRTRV